LSTLLELMNYVKADLDLDTPDGEHPFISNSEIKRHIRSSVNKCSSIIHNLYEDYYLTWVVLPVVAATQSYALPAGIYANKIRRILYDDGSLSYRVDRMYNVNEIPNVCDSDDYKYILFNAIAPLITFYPTIRASSATNVKVYHIRQTKELLLDADECDIPEFEDFVLADSKYRVLFKDFANPIRQELKQEMEEQKALMIQSLTNREPNDQTDVVADFSFYEDMI